MPNESNGSVETREPETIRTLNNWLWAYQDRMLILQSPSGIERIVFPMSADTVAKLRREMMEITL